MFIGDRINLHDHHRNSGQRNWDPHRGHNDPIDGAGALHGAAFIKSIHRQQPQRDSTADGKADLEEESHNGIDNGGIAFARF